MKHLLSLVALLLSACFLKNDPPVQSFDYGTMVDPRDGQSYRTLNYRGLTWMVQSLNWRAPGALCDSTKFGYCLYQKKQIMSDSLQIQVCPAGWHLPTIRDWAQSFYDDAGDLMDTQASFRSTDSSWYEVHRVDNTDKYGFSARPNFTGTRSNVAFLMALTSQECPNRISTIEFRASGDLYGAYFYGYLYRHKVQTEIMCDSLDSYLNKEDTSYFDRSYQKQSVLSYVDTNSYVFWQIRCVKNTTP